ncbi:hypothetical protein BTR23_22210 [Alkalihalophilus pseudofirmus]|nr:hypothetical protein BTR23_22210 [Alkalihalophilus pseudofirmus]
MELVSKYIFDQPDFPLENLDVETFYRLKIINWNEEEGRHINYRFFHKFFQINDKIYRATLRFQKKGSNTGAILDSPIPFVIYEMEIRKNGDSTSFGSTKHYMGSRFKKTSEYINEGVERDIIFNIHQDVKQCIVTNEKNIKGEEL